MTVSINLLTFNGERFIAKCLNSVLAQTYLKAEILVIDNASKDNTVELVKKVIGQANPKFSIRIIQNQTNIGFSGGHNLGIRESRGELVLCLNQDVVLAEDFIKRAVEFFEKNKNKKIAALQPKLLRLGLDNLKTDIIDTTGLMALKNRRIIARGQGTPDHGQFESEEEVFGSDGAAPVYARSALEDVKISLNGKEEYFDEDFFAYKEDVDLSWRLRLYGWKIFYVPAVVAWHGRSAGDSAATSYIDIIRERLKISKFAKYVAFKNQRLMQIKNEQVALLFRHSPQFLAKEIGSWIYVLLFERFTWRAIRDLFNLAPRALAKRRIIMSHKKADTNEMARWFC
jgi:GT2 family glycosyltransferase